MLWIFYVLMTHHDVIETCREEVSNGTEPIYEHLAELVVCEAVINEILGLGSFST